MSIEAMKQALDALEMVKSNADEWQERSGKEIKGWMKPVNDSVTSLRQAIAEAEKQEPVLVVEKESDYMSRGHFHAGTKPHIDPTKVWALPIGTKLYTHPQPKEK